VYEAGQGQWWLFHCCTPGRKKRKGAGEKEKVQEKSQMQMLEIKS